MTVVEEYSEEVVKLIFLMTLNGSITSLLVFAIKPIIKDKLPRSFQYYMWFPVVIALLLPVPKIIKISATNNSVISMSFMRDLTRRIFDAASDTPVNHTYTYNNGPALSVAVILFVFWLLGVILVLGFHIICYVSYVRRINRQNINADRQETELLNDLLKGKKPLPLYKNQMVEIPILIGFFRPAIILPDKKYEDVKLRNILMHEITHRKRHDIFVKWLLIFAGAIHWFNPLVYLVRREINKVCELACDESVIKRFDPGEMQQYGDTLIAVAADSIRKKPVSIAMLEDKRNLKERLGAIMKHKKYSKGTVVAASVILVAIVCVVLTFGALLGMENEHNYADKFPLLQDQNRIKAIELKKSLCNYDKENILDVNVLFGDLDGEITSANIFIICRESELNSEIRSGIEALISEELDLDISNIYVDYIDFNMFFGPKAALTESEQGEYNKCAIYKVGFTKEGGSYGKIIYADRQSDSGFSFYFIPRCECFLGYIRRCPLLYYPI
ncbi:MAG: M56 family metallopeptidase [Firmicutes bacterium]|nr:M56 family metallopeptidase [Bacillota bacterium]